VFWLWVLCRISFVCIVGLFRVGLVRRFSMLGARRGLVVCRRRNLFRGVPWLILLVCLGLRLVWFRMFSCFIFAGVGDVEPGV